MQHTETSLDWRLPDDLALAHRHHHIRYANPDQHYDQNYNHHQHHRHQSAPPGRSSSLYDIHYFHIHQHYRLQAAYCSFLLSHINWRTPRTFNKSTASQRQHTLCTSRSSRSSRSSRTSRNTVVPDLLTLQRPTKEQLQQKQTQSKQFQGQLSQHQEHQQNQCQQLRTRNDSCKAISVRLRPAFRLPRLPMPSMRRFSPPSDRSAQDIRTIVSNIVPPHASITSVQLLPHHSLQQVYEVKLSDTTTMLVALPPLPIRRLMRVEQDMPRSEAVVIRWIREELTQPASRPIERQTPPPPSMRTPISPPNFPSISSVSPPPSSPSSSTTASATTSPSTHSAKKLSPRPPATQGPMHHNSFGYNAGIDATSISSSIATRANLLNHIPLPVSLTSISSSDPEHRSEFVAPMTLHPLTFNVFRPTTGTPVTSLASPLTPAERMAVDYQAGKLIRQLSQLTPKSGNFGPALTVLSPQSQIGPANSPGSTSDILIGMGCWSVAFHAILESILRDGEDVAVQLPYPTVRKHFRRLGYLLDTVTTPSLVVVDAMDDTNLLVERSPALPASNSAETPSPEPPVLKPTKQRSASPTSPTTEEAASVSPDDSKREEPGIISMPLPPSPSPSLREIRSASSPPFAEASSDIVVTGFRDWSHCVFGDPLFASVFCNQPSAPFMSGFSSTDSDSAKNANNSEVILDPLEPHAAHEETEYRSARLLLYQCYHAIVQIVRGFYHPGRDRTTQELAARKRLTEILNKLEAVDEDPKKRSRHRRPSGEMSPAKKPRSESGDETPRR
ncbi:hypothetical protein F503_01928 [Ophiostoma piceae UAMH 11346]|uniref:Uncharacterized protein n=1 Tax=Ophiostoma piceae (strain UAMH 11346) TaxID=1262450 RepID=S3CSN1_OPHP1|nr:hypothetical protein F503_01928 [Ophiostoma piceae UAMH 11346]